MPDKKALLKAIAIEEALLSKLKENEKRRFRGSTPLAELETACAEPTPSCSAKTPKEKVALFRSLFRGRDDLFPKLWTSRAGKKGYSPACTNDWASAQAGIDDDAGIFCRANSRLIFSPACTIVGS